MREIAFVLDTFELTFFFLAAAFFTLALVAAAVRLDVADRVADARLSTVGSRSLRLLRVVLRPIGIVSVIKKVKKALLMHISRLMNMRTLH